MRCGQVGRCPIFGLGIRNTLLKNGPDLTLSILLALILRYKEIVQYSLEIPFEPVDIFF